VTSKIASAEVRVERFGPRRSPLATSTREDRLSTAAGPCRVSLCEILSHARTRTAGAHRLRQQTIRAVPQHPLRERRPASKAKARSWSSTGSRARCSTSRRW